MTAAQGLERSAGDLVYRFAAQAATPWLVHAVTTRLGGVSHGSFASLNLGHSVGDDPRHVAENHRQLFHALGGADRWRVVSPHQVHGARVVTVRDSAGLADGVKADGLVTDAAGVMLMLRFADCVPVLLVDGERRALGLSHAGWRGVAAGVAPATVARMVDKFGSRPEALWAGVGPAIGPCCYEVGREVEEAVLAACPPAAGLSSGGAHPRLDLARAVESQLRQAGVRRVAQANLCTACHRDQFYSHRAEDGRTGRFAVLAGIVGSEE